MNIQDVLEKLDKLFSLGQINKVEEFLVQNYKIANEEGDSSSALSILNEMIGFYRVTTQFDKAVSVIEDINNIIEGMDIRDSFGAGTSYLNIATIYRAMGSIESAKEYYQKTEEIYDRQNRNEHQQEVISLYNNMGIFFQEIGEYENAITYFNRALALLPNNGEGMIKQAITYANLGQVYSILGKWEEAKQCLDCSELLFMKEDPGNEHFSGMANAMGYYYMQQNAYEEAIRYYEMALENIAICYGFNKNFKEIQNTLFLAYEKNGNPIYENMLELCRGYYEKYGNPMIEEQFREYKDKIAVGLCGEGSQCFGMEDQFSMDHDCGPEFCMWVTKETYEKIGEKLQEAYEKLPKVYAGYVRVNSDYGKKRCGVCVIDEFYKRVLGGEAFPTNNEDWYKLEESALATATNGRVFIDAEGIFTDRRQKLLTYYPKSVWLEKLSKKLIYAAQTGQYNYGRMMARKEYVTANIILGEYMKTIIEVVYMLNKTYCPYYKWQHVMMKDLNRLPEIGAILEAVSDMPSQRQAYEEYEYNGNPNPNDMVAQTIEIIAKLVVNELKEMGLTTSENPYLEIQGYEVAKNILN